MNQFHHVLVNNKNGFEKEIWIAAIENIKPQQAEQISAGLFYGNDNKTDVSVEFFYKRMSNLLEYKSPILNEVNWEKIESIIAKNGQGRSYGMEFQYKKEFKDFNASLAYTLSRNIRRFDELNNGKWFNFTYDRTHELSLLALWKLSEKYSLSGNFSLASGTLVSLPIAYSSTDDHFYHYYIYGSINNRRLPLYHRFDVSLSRKIKMKAHTRMFYINIFNVYARQNPVFMYYDSNTGKTKIKNLFTIVPTIGYSFEF